MPRTCSGWAGTRQIHHHCLGVTGILEDERHHQSPGGWCEPGSRPWYSPQHNGHVSYPIVAWHVDVFKDRCISRILLLYSALFSANVTENEKQPNNNCDHHFLSMLLHFFTFFFRQLVNESHTKSASHDINNSFAVISEKSEKPNYKSRGNMLIKTFFFCVYGRGCGLGGRLCRV